MRRELAGAVADVGVLVPIAVALIVRNGLEPTAVLLPAGLLYLVAAGVYRLPVPVQPLKAFGAIAIAKGFGTNEIAAGALLMGAIFVTLGASGILDGLRRAFPTPLIRGVQLTVGLLFLKIAWGLVHAPSKAFDEFALDERWAVPAAAAILVTALALRRRPVALALVGAGVAVMLVRAGGRVSLGPSSVDAPSLSGAVFWSALTALVVPQVPLSFANSCLATADAARRYFGDAAERVRPGRLAVTFGSANLLAGTIGGMPVCHGAGGMTAHVAFGARTWRAPAAMGAALVLVALAAGSGLADVLTAFPLPVLAALLAAAGILHIGLLRDLAGARAWTAALLVGVLGFELNLTIGLAAGLAFWWLLPAAAARLRTAPSEPAPRPGPLT